MTTPPLCREKVMVYYYYNNDTQHLCPNHVCDFMYVDPIPSVYPYVIIEKTETLSAVRVTSRIQWPWPANPWPDWTLCQNLIIIGHKLWPPCSNTQTHKYTHKPNYIYRFISCKAKWFLSSNYSYCLGWYKAISEPLCVAGVHQPFANSGCQQSARTVASLLVASWQPHDQSLPAAGNAL